ncbi:ribosome biogenesis protein BRX1 homolog [Scyliorhinus canicula]|uniref:ribosome biogenesis protein BRX1 homolog n=1 Tax=Scyliorhinus canicula TaxID=7830 RepID=UPI0018F4EE90|nr:ribosome biogenesis protein BRX1 homolog [Scyliorhinus canicula]
MVMAGKRRAGSGGSESAKRSRGSSGTEAAGGEALVPGPVSRGKWKNKERVLIFSSRGIDFRARHLMQDLRKLMPHSKPDTKMDRKDKLFVINEICEMKNCNKCLYFEAKKKQDLYMWISNVPHGPSAKFLIQNGKFPVLGQSVAIFHCPGLPWAAD